MTAIQPRGMNDADEPLDHLTLFESCACTVKDREAGTASAGDRHAYGGVGVQPGLKIDRVTVKFATAPRGKVDAPSVSATVGTEAGEQRGRQRD